MNILGIDVSKDTLDNHLDKNGKSEYIQVSNDLSGCLKLHNFLKKSKVRKLVLAMEATGIYYETVANYFSKFYDVYVINPLKISEYSKSHFIRTKTDKGDSRLIADYVKTHIQHLHKYQSPTSFDYELKNLTALQYQLKSQVIQIKNRLQIACDEFVCVTLQSILDLLIEKLNDTTKRIDNLLKQSVYHQQYRNLQTITGIKSKTASIIISYLSVKKFENVNKFIAFIGLNPQIEQSGTSVKRKEKMSKYGHRKFKGAFYMPALAAYRSETFKSFVERLLKKGKPKKLIIGALMRKLAKIAYCVYMKNEPFSKERHLV